MFLHKDFMPYVVALYRQSIEDHSLKETVAAATSIVKALEDHKEILSFLNISFIPFNEKIDVLTQLFPKKNPMFFCFLTVLGQNHKLKFLHPILKKFLEYADHKSNTHHVNIITAFKLEANTQMALQEALEEKLKSPIKLHIAVDSSLIGGIIIRYHHQEVDLSLKSSLFSLKSNLKELYS
jgi:F-type H+-transporting ATPase subunit delta